MNIIQTGIKSSQLTICLNGLFVKALLEWFVFFFLTCSCLCGLEKAAHDSKVIDDWATQTQEKISQNPQTPTNSEWKDSTCTTDNSDTATEAFGSIKFSELSETMSKVS